MEGKFKSFCKCFSTECDRYNECERSLSKASGVNYWTASDKPCKDNYGWFIKIENNLEKSVDKDK